MMHADNRYLYESAPVPSAFDGQLGRLSAFNDESETHIWQPWKPVAPTWLGLLIQVEQQ